jgi:hypothetical protein
MGKESEEGER